MLSKAEVQAIAERAQAASEGPWRELTEEPPLDENPRDFSRSVGSDSDSFDIAAAPAADFDLILNARSDIPALVSTCEALAEALETVFAAYDADVELPTNDAHQTLTDWIGHASPKEGSDES